MFRVTELCPLPVSSVMAYTDVRRGSVCIGLWRYCAAALLRHPDYRCQLEPDDAAR